MTSKLKFAPVEGESEPPHVGCYESFRMGAHPLSPATQATLLLCSPLRAGRNKDVQPLSIGEFNELENQLARAGAGLEQLLETGAAALLKKISPAVEAGKIEALLGRGFMLSLAVETWQSAGVWVTSRTEPDYPERLRRLKQNAPPLIYGCGEKSLLSRGGLAMVGSRDVDLPGEEFTKRVAAAAAREDMQVVSGGARGVDQFAMLYALEAGGTVVGVLADSLLRSATAGKARESIQDGRLTLVSAFDPEAGFNVGNAMQRNKQIYALADFGLVVSSGFSEGGTWSGAIEQLDKLQLVPLFVRDEANVPKGNRELLRRGATGFPAGWLPGRLSETLKGSAKGKTPTMETADLFAAPALHESPPEYRGSHRKIAAVKNRK
ncbi:MAG: DNA-protecting protein DprA [Verrucomicrobia bacterium]|nr:DNA-protecting protein DprA [Verrucomicrobiota bacterium]